MSMEDLDAIRVTGLLALISVIVLLVIATPIAWWLAFTRSRARPVAEALVALPLVLPPTVMGFYLLVLLGPLGAIGAPFVALTGETLTFSFGGLVVASVLHSLPFAVQPLQGAFENVGRSTLEAAASLRASPFDAFRSVAAPLALRGYVTAAVLTFAHTLGEFGVLLMVGGNIPGRTRVISIAIYEHVETLDYGAAHRLAGGLLVVSFGVLLAVYLLNGRFRVRAS